MLLGGLFQAWRSVCRGGARRERFLFQGEQCLNQSVCVRAGRAAGLALWAGRKMSTAQLYTWETLLACESGGRGNRRAVWLVALTLRVEAERLRFGSAVTAAIEGAVGGGER